MKRKFLYIIEPVHLQGDHRGFACESGILDYLGRMDHFPSNQCPFKGGPSVYGARALLRLVNDSLQYDDAGACLQVGIFRATEIEPKQKESTVKLVPNPANQFVSIVLNENINGEYWLKITDPLGRLINKELILFDKGNAIVATDKLKPGIYFVALNAPLVANTRAQLIIIR